MSEKKFIRCPLPERKKYGEEMLLSYCCDKCPNRETWEGWRKEKGE